MQNKSFDLNLPLQMGLSALAAIAFAGFGFYASTLSVQRFSRGRGADIAAQMYADQQDRESDRTRKEFELRADRAQAAIDNDVNLFDSVTVENYICDPNEPPLLDWQRYAQPGVRVNVADRNQRLVGYIWPDNTFTFKPRNCQ